MDFLSVLTYAVKPPRSCRLSPKPAPLSFQSKSVCHFPRVRWGLISLFFSPLFVYVFSGSGTGSVIPKIYNPFFSLQVSCFHFHNRMCGRCPILLADLSLSTDAEAPNYSCHAYSHTPAQAACRKLIQRRFQNPVAVAFRRYYICWLTQNPCGRSPLWNCNTLVASLCGDSIF